MADDPKLHHYPDTVLRFDGFLVDLRKPLATDEVNQVVEKVGPQFAVISACNPYGRQLTASENEVRTSALEDSLFKISQPIPVYGESPDGEHVEKSFAIVVTLHEAKQISEKFEQTALFWFDGRRFWLCFPGSRDRVPLPR